MLSFPFLDLPLTLGLAPKVVGTISRRETLASRRDELLKMTRAVHRTLGWFAKAPALEIANLLYRYFPGVPIELFAQCIERYRALKLNGAQTNEILAQAGALVRERVAPILLHALEALRADQFGRVKLRIAMDRLVPVPWHLGMTGPQCTCMGQQRCREFGMV